MGRRQGTKCRLFMSTKRRKCMNLVNYNRCKRAELPYVNQTDNVGQNLLPDFRNEDHTCKSFESDSENIESSYSFISNVDLDVNMSNAAVNEISTDSSTPSGSRPQLEDLSQEMLANDLPTNYPQSCKIVGRRIIQLQYFLDSLKNISTHGLKFGCSFQNLEVVKESQLGLNSLITFKCNMCNEEYQVFTNTFNEKENDSTMNVNTACVEGIMGIGGGFYNAEEFLASLEIPCMNSKTYDKHHSRAANSWKTTALKKMKEAAEMERQIAEQKGNLDENGIPCITVVADGCWSKRSYRTQYNALSGSAAIIGLETGQVLYLGIKNKYCITCLSAEEKKEEPKGHVCFKNYSGSSAGMESQIIVEGFLQSMELHGLKYTKIVADGDSSTYKKILDARPYKNISVEKIECRNHLLRNYCNKLRILTTDTHYPLNTRKLLTEAKIMKLRGAVIGAINHRKKLDVPHMDKIEGLREDIDNGIYHVFGRHEHCNTYYCTGGKDGEEDVINKMQSSSDFFKRLQVIVKQLSIHARSLIYDLDSNIVEQFNSKIAKFIGGKRVNYSKGESYQSRCYLAAVSHNTGRPHYEFHKDIVGKSPSKIKTKFEEQRILKSRRKLQYKAKSKNRKLIHKNKHTSSNPHYGIKCQKPDMEPEVFDREKAEYLNALRKTDIERQAFERNTVLQSGSCLWLEHRRKMLTASNFYNVCVRRPYTSCQRFVRRLLYDSKEILEHVEALNHGRLNEERAREQLEKQLNCSINKCGLFIDAEYPFLGASPDGIIETESILVEIKCPFSAYNSPIEEAIQNRKVTFWKKNNTVNKRHPWYFQIQGQLRVTNQRSCVLAVWTSEEQPLKVEYITRDNEFWKGKMEKQLVQFYMDCVLPELVDPREKRSMPIRDPEYILEAIKNHANKKT